MNHLLLAWSHRWYQVRWCRQRVWKGLKLTQGYHLYVCEFVCKDANVTVCSLTEDTFDVKRHMRGMQQAGIPGKLAWAASDRSEHWTMTYSCFITSNLSLLPRCFKALSLTLTYGRVWEWEYYFSSHCTIRLLSSPCVSMFRCSSNCLFKKVFSGW